MNKYLKTAKNKMKGRFVMDTDIRKYIINTFKDDNESEIRESIEDSIKEGLEETLPGLGVFMEVIWNNASEELKKELLGILKAHMN